MNSRSPYDGEPFYCAICGMGWEEFGACEEPDCELETEATALARRLSKDATEAAARRRPNGGKRKIKITGV